MNKELNTKRGFTLMELLVAIAIVGILAGIGSIAFSSVQQRGRDAKRKEDLQSLKIALEAYHADNNQYSPSPCTDPTFTSSDATQQPQQRWIDFLTPTYIKQLPVDPKPGFTYQLSVTKNCQNFILWAKLESTTDPEAYNPNTGGWSQQASCNNNGYPPPSDYNYCVQNP